MTRVLFRTVGHLTTIAKGHQLEIEFDVEVPDYELQDVKTFAALAEVIDTRR